MGQQYVLKELRCYHALLDAEDEKDLKAQISMLEEAFKQPMTAAIKRSLNTLRRSGVEGRPLVQNLTDLYQDHSMKDRDFQRKQEAEAESDRFPRIICSEAII